MSFTSCWGVAALVNRGATSACAIATEPALRRITSIAIEEVYKPGLELYKTVDLSCKACLFVQANAVPLYGVSIAMSGDDRIALGMCKGGRREIQAARQERATRV